MARTEPRLQPETPERLDHDGLRLGELQPDLRPAVDPAARVDHLGEDRLGGGAKDGGIGRGHRISLSGPRQRPCGTITPPTLPSEESH